MTTTSQQHTVTAETDAALSTLVVNAVSGATETPADELPPLYRAIDPEALDVLISGCDTDSTVEFQYAGRTVTISVDRTVEVSPATPRPDRPAEPYE